MSYIRSLSNPESLYVYGDGKNINFHWLVKPPFASPGGGMKIPHDIFTKAGQKWAEQFSGDKKVSVGGFTIEEVHVYDKTAKKVRPGAPFNLPPTRFGWKLSYKGQFVILWAVTMHYMMDRFLLAARDKILARSPKETKDRSKKK